MKTKNEIRSACENFLETWERREWMSEHGEWVGDEIAEGVIDPDGVEGEAVALDVSVSRQGWECREGWQAMRAGDALVINWFRIPITALRHDRDLYVVIDREFFQTEGE